MPTLGQKGTKTIESLREFAPFDYWMLTDSKPGWAAGINRMLANRNKDFDVLIIDDDVVIQEHTFDLLDELYDAAEVFGFKLLYPDGGIQHDGAYVRWDGTADHIRNLSEEPSYVGSVTASLCYIKSHVFDYVPGYPEWPGLQWEDVAFCLDCWFARQRVMYVPGEAIHEEGGTKMKSPDFWRRFHQNQALFRQEYGRKAMIIAQMFGATHRISLVNADKLPVPSLQ